MICPACGHDNIQGVDECENCGADLRTSDIPHPGEDFEARLIGEPLRALEPRPPLALDAGTSAAEAVATMQREDIEALVVEEGGRLVGIITDRDAMVKLGGRSMDGISVVELMTRDPVVLRGDDTMAVAIHKMALGGFRHIPIVADGRATGMVSAGDIFRHILDILGTPARDPSA